MLFLSSMLHAYTHHKPRLYINITIYIYIILAALVILMSIFHGVL